jgi:hypothetical protein
LAYEVSEERCYKSGNAITIEQTEDVLLVLEVVNDTVGITIEGRTSVARASL